MINSRNPEKPTSTSKCQYLFNHILKFNENLKVKMTTLESHKIINGRWKKQKTCEV